MVSFESCASSCASFLFHLFGGAPVQTTYLHEIIPFVPSMHFFVYIRILIIKLLKCSHSFQPLRIPSNMYFFLFLFVCQHYLLFVIFIFLHNFTSLQNACLQFRIVCFISNSFFSLLPFVSPRVINFACCPNYVSAKFAGVRGSSLGTVVCYIYLYFTILNMPNLEQIIFLFASVFRLLTTCLVLSVNHRITNFYRQKLK